MAQYNPTDIFSVVSNKTRWSKKSNLLNDDFLERLSFFRKCDDSQVQDAGEVRWQNHPDLVSDIEIKNIWLWIRLHLSTNESLFTQQNTCFDLFTDVHDKTRVNASPKQCFMNHIQSRIFP